MLKKKGLKLFVHILFSKIRREEGISLQQLSSEASEDGINDCAEREEGSSSSSLSISSSCLTYLVLFLSLPSSEAAAAVAH